MKTGIQIIWRISAVVVLCLMVAAYVLSIALRPDPVVGEKESASGLESSAPKVNTIVQ